MSIYARRNLLIAAFGPNMLLTQPLQAGQVMLYDPTKGGFINSPSSDLVNAANLGTGVHVYDGKVGLGLNGAELQFNTLVAGPNVSVDKIGNNIQISSNVSGPGSGVLVVLDIPSRDALIPSFTSDALVFVQSDQDNEYALYLWDFTNTIFKKLATQDSAETDAKSLSYTLNFNSSSTIILGNVSPGSRVVGVSIRVITPFNGTPLLSIGDDTNGVDVHMDPSFNDLTVLDQFVSESNFTYTGTQDTDIKAYFNTGGCTVGQAQIIVSYV